MKRAYLQEVAPDVVDIPYQETSFDIWDKKYRLKAKDGTIIDKTIDGTYERVARALADVEESQQKRDYWFEQFLWALRHGAIPAGRIISNAGALQHKPATSTINCTVSGTIKDSMDDILNKVHEAGLTLKAGCGIGYEHSTLRPKGAYVSGAGAYTSGPLSFMDIYDKMCFTVSSAGGRRGAQMSTFDVGHPDVMDFVRAKRENGRLRQFNLSLLVTEEFMQAVENDAEWPLAFPLTAKEVKQDELDIHDPQSVIWREWPIHKGYVTDEAGLVACKIYKTLRARHLWDMIMSSTYDFAEPGFILIDQYNKMNNNWFCENIRATNPCVTVDTWVQTAEGPRQVKDLMGKAFYARVDGVDHITGKEGFFRTGTKQVVRLQTSEGYKLQLTTDHRIRRVTRFNHHQTETEWCEVSALRSGDRILLNDHRPNCVWQGKYTCEQGYLMGLLIGNGTLKQGAAVLALWRAAAAVVNDGEPELPAGVRAVMTQALTAVQSLSHRNDCGDWFEIAGRGEYCLFAVEVKRLAEELGMHSSNKCITSAMEQASSKFYGGFMRGLFDVDGFVQDAMSKNVSIRLALSDRTCLEVVQRMLLRMGIASRIGKIRPKAVSRRLPGGWDSVTGQAIKPQYELIISGENLQSFAQTIGFGNSDKANCLQRALQRYSCDLSRERFVARVEDIIPEGMEHVFDVQVPGIHTFDANGLHAHNCGEQGLPPYGACLLGSVNLTKFVRDPFTDEARFDWDEFRKTVAVFTRMLDNVVEINGLPLESQRDEIVRKRRHGMGFLGLGSTLTLLRMKYGTKLSVDFTEQISRELAITGWRAALELAREKGSAPIMEEDFEVTAEMLRKRPEMKHDGYKPGDMVKGKVLHARYGRYMQQLAVVAPELVDQLSKIGARFTHHSSIAPTGTISLSLANNASNGIEPSFAHHYSRNVIREGRKTKEKVEVYSFELLAYRELVNSSAMSVAETEEAKLPDYFVTAEDITPKAHVDIQAASQKWIDSSISKTANVPTDYPYEDFKDIYLYAYKQGLKGCTTFRFNPEAFQGVLVKEKDLQDTTYRFTLDDGCVVEAKGNEEIEYDGETHSAANLFDALKEGYYGKF